MSFEEKLKAVDELRNELLNERKLRRDLRRKVEDFILSRAENGGFRPSGYYPELWDLGVTNRNGQVYRVCERLKSDGVLEKHRTGEYGSEKGRELDTVWYTLRIETKRPEA